MPATRSVRLQPRRLLAGRSAQSAPAISAIRRFVLLLREHIAKENDVLFPMSDQVLPQAEQAAMMGKFEQAEMEIAGPKVHQQLIADLERLEAAHK